MLIRVVRMTFQPAEVDNFLDLFDSNKNRIRNFPGCHHLELLRDINQENVLTTYSLWQDEQSLNNYRNSTIFAEVWHQTKIKFAAKPIAYSMKKIVEVGD